MKNSCFLYEGTTILLAKTCFFLVKKNLLTPYTAMIYDKRTLRVQELTSTFYVSLLVSIM